MATSAPRYFFALGHNTLPFRFVCRCTALVEVRVMKSDVSNVLLVMGFLAFTLIIVPSLGQASWECDGMDDEEEKKSCEESQKFIQKWEKENNRKRAKADQEKLLAQALNAVAMVSGELADGPIVG